MKSKPCTLSLSRKCLSNLTAWTNQVNKSTFAILLALLVCAGGFWRFHNQPNTAAPQVPQADPNHLAAINEAYGKLPLSFEVAPHNATNTQFITRGAGYRLGLSPNQVQIQLHPSQKPDRTQHRLTKLKPEPASTPVRVKMELVGANAQAPAQTSEPLSGKVNYFVGKNPSQWQQNIPTFGRVEYANVYPDINLVYYGNQHQLEYDFVVQPGADPSQIKLKFEGADQVSINAQGELSLLASNREIKQHKPFIYQEINGQKKQIEGAYTMLASNEVGFQLGQYNPALTLVIDPVLVYSTYLGGSGNDTIFDVRVDKRGAAYITGLTYSDDFPVRNGVQPTINDGDADVFVSKLRADGSALIYSTYLGGTDFDYANVL